MGRAQSRSGGAVADADAFYTAAANAAPRRVRLILILILLGIPVFVIGFIIWHAYVIKFTTTAQVVPILMLLLRNSSFEVVVFPYKLISFIGYHHSNLSHVLIIEN